MDCPLSMISSDPSIMLKHGSTEQKFEYFKSLNLVYSKNFIYQASNYKIVRTLLEVQNNFLNRQHLLFIHFDNNDISQPYSIENKYFYSTSYVIYLVDTDGIDLSKIFHHKTTPSRSEMNEMVNNLYNYENFEIEEKKSL